MSTISVAAPVPAAKAPAQAAASSSSSAGAAPGSDGKPSFANCLKESSADADKKEQTAATPGLHASPKSTVRSDKQPRRSKTSEAPLPTASAPVPQPQVADPRGLLLSWRIAPQETADSKKADSGKDEGAVPGSATSVSADAQDAVAIASTHLAAKTVRAAASPSTNTNAKDPIASAGDTVVTASEAVSAPSPAPAPIAFGVNIPHPSNVHPAFNATAKDFSGTGAVKESAPQGKNHRAETSLPVIQKAQAEQASNGSKGGKEQGHAKEKDADSSSAPAGATASTNQAKQAEAAAQPAGVAPKVEAAPATLPAHVAAAYNTTPSVKANAPVAALQPAAVTEPPAALPLRAQSIDLKVPGAGDSQVDVRVSQRAGDVEVTVRTPDTGLADSLRQHLPELSDRLSQSGVHGDVWQPSAEAPADNHSQSDPGSEGRWQGQQQEHQQRQQQDGAGSQQRESSQSSWLNEFYTDKEGN